MDIVRSVKHCIIGSGPQGIILAARLMQTGEKDILVVDPHGSPAELLNARFADCETHHLRSGCAEHCHPFEDALRGFCESTGRASELVTDKHRPTVELFMSHTRLVWDEYKLAALQLQAWVANLKRAQNGQVIVVTNRGQILSENVYLCIGQPTPAYPEWATTTRGHNPRVSHIFDNDYELSELPPGEQVIVVGGGITAAQVASSIAKLSDRRVTLVTRRPLSGGEGTTNTVDWLDPERRARLCALPWVDRYAFMEHEGDRGTVPFWELDRITEHKREGRIVHRVTEVSHLAPTNEHVCLIDANGEEIHGNLIVLATGLQLGLPLWLKAASDSLGLPLDSFGNPCLKNNLEWGKGIYVHGSLARPIVGPFGGNIVGGMIAAQIQIDRITAAM